MAECKDKEFLLEFIEFYRSLPALWDVRCEDYRNRDKREEQKEQLLQKYRERYPTAEKKDVAKKINNLRSNYKRELKRLNDMDRSAAGVNDTCETTLFYFEAMSFVNDIQTRTKSRSTFQETDVSPAKKKKSDTSAVDDLVRLATEHLNKPQDVLQNIGNIWGCKLGDMERDQRLIAEKLINEVMFNGQMGFLNCNTALINLERPSYQNSSNQYSVQPDQEYFDNGIKNEILS